MAKGETLGGRLLRLRLEAGLTQARLAEQAKVSVHTLRNWEHDRRLPRLNAVYRMAQVLGVPMEAFVEGTIKPGQRQRRPRPAGPSRLRQ